jgi:hypothetical protein
MNVVFRSTQKVNYVKYKIRTVLTVSVASPFLEDIPFDSEDIKHFQQEENKSSFNNTQQGKIMVNN